LLSISRWPTDLAVLIREVAEGVRATTRHEINVSAEGGVIGDWDERRIRQVILNLLSNALKYSPEGSTIRVSLVTDGQSATVSVSDEGIGLDRDELGHVPPRIPRRAGATGEGGRTRTLPCP